MSERMPACYTSLTPPYSEPLSAILHYLSPRIPVVLTAIREPTLSYFYRLHSVPALPIRAVACPPIRQIVMM